MVFQLDLVAVKESIRFIAAKDDLCGIYSDG